MNHLINLTNPESNFPPIKISTYPDSQVSVEIEVWEGYANINSGDTFTILSRMSSYSDLIKIVAANQVLQENGMRTELDCPYILGARSDRRFKMTQSFDLKIVADILNSCNFDRVIVLDAHSDVLPAMINRCIVRQTNWWISEFSINWKDYLLISPDAGAYKKSAKGLIKIIETNRTYEYIDQVSQFDEGQGCLETVFENGILIKQWTLKEIRERLWKK